MQEEDINKNTTIMIRKIRILIIFLLAGVFGYSQVTLKYCGSNDDYSCQIPFNRSNNCNYWRGIYNFSEFNKAGSLTAISFYKQTESEAVSVKMIEVYVKISQLSNFDNPIWDVSSWTKVFAGEISDMNEEGWKEIVFNSPITLSIGDNLFIAVKQGYQDADENLVGFSVYSSSTGASQYSNSNTDFISDLQSITVKPYLKLEFEGFHADAGDIIYASPGAQVSLGGNPSSIGINTGLTYSWSPSNDLSSSTLSNPILDVRNNGTYSLSISDGLSVSSSLTNVHIINNGQDLSTDQNTRYYLDDDNNVSFFDSQGEGAYNNAEHYYVTFIPNSEGVSRIEATFYEFNIIGTENSGDYLKVYSGESVDDNELIGKYYGTEMPDKISSNHPSGAITFEFYSDGKSTSMGWNIFINSVSVGTCNEPRATVINSIQGDDIVSGTAGLSLNIVLQGSQFESWQKQSFVDDSWIDIPNSTQSFTTDINNTTTKYRARVSHPQCPDSEYSDIITYRTSNNYYVNDNSSINDIYCNSLGSTNNSGLSPNNPNDKLSYIINKYNLSEYDSVFIDDGTYSDYVFISGEDYGSPNGNISILGAGGNSTIINLESENGLYIFGASYVGISKTRFNTASKGKLIKIDAAKYIDISECRFESNEDIMTVNNSNDISISKDYFLSESTENTLLAIGSSSNINIEQNWLQKGNKGIEILGNCDNININRSFIANSPYGIKCLIGDNNPSINIFNNSFYCSQNCININSQGSFDNIDIINNMLTTSVAGTNPINIIVPVGTDINRDHNLYYIEGGSTSGVEVINGVPVPFSTENGTGSVYDNPNYCSPENGALFSANSYSGASTKFNFDISGVDISSNNNFVGGSFVNVTINESFAILQKELDGGVFYLNNSILRFVMNNDNNIIGEDLKYTLYKYGTNGQEEYCKNTDSNSPNYTLSSGKNYVQLDFGWNIIPNGNYLLKVENHKNEISFLRFKVDIYYGNGNLSSH